MTMRPVEYGSLVISTSPGSHPGAARVPACIATPISGVAPLP
jgi:hypothetical protein